MYKYVFVCFVLPKLIDKETDFLEIKDKSVLDNKYLHLMFKSP